MVSTFTIASIIRKPISGEQRAVASGSDCRLAILTGHNMPFSLRTSFCHAIANYSNNPQQLVRYRRHPNLWLEEGLWKQFLGSLCEP
jgi:hypothetical protein